MRVSRSAYYAWRERRKKACGEQELIRAAVKEVFYFHKRRYGSRRVSEELKETGIKAGRFVVTRVMREEGLKAKYPRAFRPGRRIRGITNSRVRIC
ncbi:MAG: IS3 family transposase [Pyrinomonadaceae bacterium]